MTRRAAWMVCVGLAIAAGALVNVQAAPGERVRRGKGERLIKHEGPLVLGHRGSTGALPEHTIESYTLAILQGADYIEPDLVSTKDGVLIARHEVNITGTTNVADHPEFASRRTTRTIDGISETGWFADDFTLAEIRTLRAIQRVDFRPQQFDGQFVVPTLAEVIALAKEWSKRTGRQIGIYPETKHPTYHQSVGLPLEEPLVAALEEANWNRKNAPVFIQSFEIANLKKLNRMTRVKLVQLIDALDTAVDGTIIPYSPYDVVAAGGSLTYADMVTPAGLADIATYADGVGPWKRYIVSVRGVDRNGDGNADDVNGDGAVDDADKQLTDPTALVSDAHSLGLLVHPFTFRNEPTYLGAEYEESPIQEYLHFFCIGVDGLFSDFPDTAVTARYLVPLSPCWP